MSLSFPLSHFQWIWQKYFCEKLHLEWDGKQRRRRRRMSQNCKSCFPSLKNRNGDSESETKLGIFSREPNSLRNDGDRALALKIVAHRKSKWAKGGKKWKIQRKEGYVRLFFFATFSHHFLFSTFSLPSLPLSLSRSVIFLWLRWWWVHFTIKKTMYRVMSEERGKEERQPTTSFEKKGKKVKMKRVQSHSSSVFLVTYYFPPYFPSRSKLQTSCSSASRTRIAYQRWRILWWKSNGKRGNEIDAVNKVSWQ